MSDDKPYPYKVTTFPAEDDPGWFEADVWDCPECGVKKIAEDCPECPGCLAAQPEGSVYRGRCWGMKLPESFTSLADLPRREPKEEVCEHCGATYTGLFHCQSALSSYKDSITEIMQEEDSRILAALLDHLPLDSHMVEGREMKVVREMVPVDDAIEYGECPVCGAEPGQQCSVTDLDEYQPEGPAYVSTTELAGWVHPERGE